MASNTLVIDNGAYTIKAGFAGDDVPETTVHFLENKSMFKSQTNMIDTENPIKHGLITDFDSLEYIWDTILTKILDIECDDTNILLTEKPLTPKTQKEIMSQIVFEKFDSPKLYIGIDKVLSLYSYGKTTGIVIDSGYDMTHTVPIWEGYCIPYAINKLYFGGKHITKYVSMEIADSALTTRKKVYPFRFWGIAEEIKEKVCHVASYYDPYYTTWDPKYYELPDGKYMKIEDVQNSAVEIYFQPNLYSFNGMRNKGIHQWLLQSIFDCHIDVASELLYGNIVLSGGSTMFKGFSQRLHKELTNFEYNTRDLVNGFIRRYTYDFNDVISTDIENIISANIGSCKKKKGFRNICIVGGNQYSGRQYAAWRGGSVLASLSIFDQMSLSKKEYDEAGASIVHRQFV